MLITKNIKIDFVQRGMPPQLHAVQGDCLSRDICIYLYDGGTPWEVPVDATPVLRFGRADGSGGLYDTLPDGNLAWAIDGNRVSVILAPAVLAAAGLVQCQLMLLQGEACLSTFSFDIIVEPDPSLGTTESESYYNWSRKFIEVPQAAVGQIIQVKAVDTEGVATEWEAVELPTVPAALPNPYPLILTGAVNAEYDGTEAVSVEIPEPGRDFSLYGLGTADNPLLIPSDYALADMKNSGWYSIELGYGTVDFGDGFTANKFLLRVESGASEQYTSVTKQTAIFASYPGAEEYFRYCKNGYDWTAWQSAKAGGGGGLTRTLLWENADIGSEFAEQTITLDALQDCDAIEILFYSSTYLQGYGPCYLSSGALPKLTDSELKSEYYDWGYILQSVADFYGVAANPSFRLVRWEDTQITFGDCYRIVSGRPENKNYANVPVQIYGIKGVESL